LVASGETEDARSEVKGHEITNVNVMNYRITRHDNAANVISVVHFRQEFKRNFNARLN